MSRACAPRAARRLGPRRRKARALPALWLAGAALWAGAQTAAPSGVPQPSREVTPAEQESPASQPVRHIGVAVSMADSDAHKVLLPRANAALVPIAIDEAATSRRRWVGVLAWSAIALLLVLLGYAAFYAVNRRLHREVALRRQSEADLVRANQARDRAEARYRETIDASPNLLLVLDSQLHIRQISQPLARLAGYERSELVGQPATCLAPERLREEFMATCRAFFRAPAPTPTHTDRPSLMLCKDGSERAVETTLNPINAGEDVFAIMAVIDVAPRLEAQNQLRESEARLRDLFDNATDMIQAVDPTGRFVFVNRSWCAAMGYSAEEARTLTLETILHPDCRDRCLALFERVLQGQDIGRFDAVFVTRAGDSIDVEGHADLRIAKGRLESTRSILRDVTERNRQMAELAQAKQRAESADRTKSAFLATMSHELRTPLNSIIGFTSILREGLAGPVNPEQARQLAMVQASSQHLLALINDVLDVSRIEAGELAVERQSVDLRALIDKVTAIVKPLADKKGLALRTTLPPAIAPVAGDARRIEQILLNLLSNAIKFTQQGEVELGVRGAGGSLRVSVRDTGMGIKAQDIDRLFQPFSQIDDGLARNRDGTGLGLVICRHLARLMGGEVEVQSEWGKGSTFTFVLAWEAPQGGDD